MSMAPGGVPEEVAYRLSNGMPVGVPTSNRREETAAEREVRLAEVERKRKITAAYAAVPLLSVDELAGFLRGDLKAASDEATSWSSDCRRMTEIPAEAMASALRASNVPTTRFRLAVQGWRAKWQRRRYTGWVVRTGDKEIEGSRIGPAQLWLLLTTDGRAVEISRPGNKGPALDRREVLSDNRGSRPQRRALKSDEVRAFCCQAIQQR